MTPLLNTISSPEDVRKLSADRLGALAAELRAKTIEVVSQTGGHLGAGLGVVELTLALHYVFNTPHDTLVWDIGHQCYPHKILTGRKDAMLSLRKAGGLSGFLRREESPYDAFGAGHSSTSISAALGMALARDLKGESRNVIAVIGDGSISAGMAYEALNHAGSAASRFIVILNDNNMSIAPPVGGVSQHLRRLVASKPFLNMYDIARNLVSHLPSELSKMVKHVSKSAKNLAFGTTIFEQIGFDYFGPIDGHNLTHLIPILESIRDHPNPSKPILLHIVTEKGRGFPGKHECAEKFHAVAAFDAITGVQKKIAAPAPSYTEIFARGLITEATHDASIVAITAAMPSGTGLDKFARAFPKRCFDVGIAEQHAVTMAAGLACEGMKPFVAIYSTFLQRAYDQIVHDIALQSLPVRFAIDRAGYVGADGPTHNGAFDITYLATLPNMVVMAPSDEVELLHAIATVTTINNRPSAFRYPRGASLGLPLPERGQILPLGKGRIVRASASIQQTSSQFRVAILSLGTRLAAALDAATNVSATDPTTAITVADARFAKPLDTELIRTLLLQHHAIITVEEGSIGGFGAHVSHFLHSEGLLDGQGKILRSLCFPDLFLEHDTQDALNHKAGVDSAAITSLITELKQRFKASIQQQSTQALFDLTNH